MELHNQVVISMDSLMELVAEAAAKTAIGVVYNEEHQMKRKDRRRRILRNTRVATEGVYPGHLRTGIFPDRSMTFQLRLKVQWIYWT